MCQQEDFINRVTVGPHKGLWLCSFPCAHIAYVNHYTELSGGVPEDRAATLPTLKFHEPSEELADLAQQVNPHRTRARAFGYRAYGYCACDSCVRCSLCIWLLCPWLACARGYRAVANVPVPTVPVPTVPVPTMPRAYHARRSTPPTL